MALNLVKTFFDQEIEIYGDELALERAQFAAVYGAENSAEAATNGQTAPTTLPAALDVSHAEDLPALYQTIKDCRQCSLSARRNQLVFGSGNERPDIVLIGEQPSVEDDATGLIMSGAAGELLDKILASIHLTREQVYLCHLVKCLPPGHREPRVDELKTCQPYLEKQLALLRPKFILCLGRLAAALILDKKSGLTQLRGTVHQAFGAQVVATYNPAALLRYPQFKRDVWEDVKLLRRVYDQYLAQTA